MTDFARATFPEAASLSTSQRRGPPRIALVDARPIVREGVTRWLRAVKRGCQVSCFSSAAEALASGRILDTDVIVLSTGSDQAAERHMLEVVENLASEIPEKPIIVLSDGSELAALEAIRRGVRAYIPVTLESTVAMAAVKLVMLGGYFIPTPILIGGHSTHGYEHETPQSPEPTADQFGWAKGTEIDEKKDRKAAPLERLNGEVAAVLTSRESEVLACIQQGKPNKVIAFELNIRVSTVKVHVGNLMKKLNAANRTQLAVRVPPPRLTAE